MENKEKLWNGNYLKMLVGNFSLFFSFMLLAPLLPLYLSETFGADKQIIGLVLSGYTITALVSRAVSGYIVDSFPRKAVLLTGFFVFAMLFGGYLIAGSLLAFAVLRTIHGIPYGMATVSNNTVAVDVLPASRRAEGIGYYGLSNNVATAISPTIALWIYAASNSYDLLFLLSLGVAVMGFVVVSSVRLKPFQRPEKRPKLTFDRLFLLKGWSLSVSLICYAFSYGVVATYVAIYGKEELGITGGTGLFFALFSLGLILSRLTGSRALKKGLVAHNAGLGSLVSMFGFLLFAVLHNPIGYYGAALVIGLGNGHMYPAFQSMLVELAPPDHYGTANSTLLVSWDIGVGIGIILGGSIAEAFGYHATFWTAWVVCAVGVAFYFLYSQRNYFRNRLSIQTTNK